MNGMVPITKNCLSFLMLNQQKSSDAKHAGQVAALQVFQRLTQW